METISIEALVKEATEKKVKISDILIDREAEKTNTTREEIIKKMDKYYQVMKEAVENSRDTIFNFKTGLQNDIVALAKNYYSSKKTISGSAMSDVVIAAMSVSGYNASMGKVIAAPTAGSCGIMPAVLTTLEKQGIPRDNIVKSMFTAAGLADIIARNATFAGAEGGCQAECGSACAMASSAFVEASGGSPSQCADAFAWCLSNLLGMVCDPVAGYVEIPCMGKNIVGSINAVVCAELALAGVQTVIPADEVVMAMKEVGDAMPAKLKETGEGGLAATPTGKKIAERLLGKRK